MTVRVNQYYGFFDYSDNNTVFYVVVIKPAGSRISDWIGSKNAKLTDLLCIDDYIISHCDFKVDWSKVNER